ncbi:MAG: hypothetical protein ACYC97_04420 [Metallibacterium sp.]
MSHIGLTSLPGSVPGCAQEYAQCTPWGFSYSARRAVAGAPAQPAAQWQNGPVQQEAPP